MRRAALSVIVAGLALGACGKAAPPKHAATGCLPAVTAALHTAAGTKVTASPAAAQFGIATCTYHLAGGPRVTVIVDSHPQASRRFERAVVETDQNALWSTTPALAPRLVTNVGAGADWVPANRELIATDDRVLLGVTVIGDDRHAKALAIVATRASLRRRSAR